MHLMCCDDKNSLKDEEKVKIFSTQSLDIHRQHPEMTHTACGS